MLMLWGIPAQADTLGKAQITKNTMCDASAPKSERTATEVTAVTLEKTKSIRVGQTVALRATVLPEKAVARDLIWSSSNSSVVSVSANGKIFGMSAGEAVITARSANGKKAFCKVTVGITSTRSYDDFGMATAELVKENQSFGESQAAQKNEFFAKRLIVRSKGGVLDFSKVKASAIVKSPDHVYYIVQFATAAATQNAMKTIEKWPGVAWVEPDGCDNYQAVDGTNVAGTKKYAAGQAGFDHVLSVVEDAEESDDASFSALEQTFELSGRMDSVAGLDSAQAKSWGVARIGAAAYAKRVAARTSATIKVAVVDSGVDKSHPFLSSRITSDGYDFVDNDSYPYYDGTGHGTHVAGTIVDCTPGLKVKIMSVRVIDSSGEGWHSDIVAGIRYAADHGAKVINLSLGGRHSHYKDEAIDYAINKGVTVVVAAGNENESTSASCPAHLSRVICVGAVNSSNRRADFSNYGKTLDLVAPGVSIRSSVPGGYYKNKSGTSMATPHISALAAIMKLCNPSMTPAQIESALKNHCKDLGSKGRDQYYGYGIPDFTVGKSIAVTKVTLNKSSVSVQRGKKYTLKATVVPSNATNKKITWSSSNTSVASVSSGVVTAKKAGTATITAKSSNGKLARCKVTVVNAVPSKLAAPTLTYKRMDSDGWINLMWNPVSGATGYRVTYYNYATGTTGTQYLSGRSNTDWYRYVSSNTAYRVAIRAYKVQSGQRIFGSTRVIYIAPAPSMWGTDATSSAITIHWTKIKGVSGYRIYRSASQKSGYRLVKTCSAASTSYRFNGLGNARVYVRLIPYRTVNGQKVNLPYGSGSIS